jgi:hypothetical protein
MEKKTAEDYISSLTVGGYAAHGEQLYDAGEVKEAMEEYSNQHLAEYKAKLKRHLRTSGKWKWSTGELTDLIDSIT